MKIGVFDSGIGGKSVAETLQRDYPDIEVLYVSDTEHVPYGSRSEEEIVRLTDNAIQPLIKVGCDVIVLACNTATAAAIEILRGRYPGIPFIGLEPMVKPAAELTKSNVIAICATPYTLGSQRYKNLKETYGEGVTILEPDCSQWAYLIEHNRVDRDSIAQTVSTVCEAGADVIVLACTHYHWIKEDIVHAANGRAAVIDPSDAISRRVKTVLGL